MEHFKLPITVQDADIDVMGHVNNVVYVRWAQDVAVAHWHAIASSELQRKYLWVVLRHEIDYKHPAFITDGLVGETWVGQHHGARFERFVKISNTSGKIFAEVKTMWCMLDGNSLRPTRIPEEVLQVL